MKLLGHRSAADDVARLDDPYLQTRFREIEGADEAVVAGTDDEGVIGFGHETSFASGDSTCRRPKPRPRTRPGIRRSKGMRSSRRRSEEHTSELQSLMRISYAVFCLQKTKRKTATEGSTY